MGWFYVSFYPIWPTPTPSSISTLAVGIASVFYFHKFSASSNLDSVWKLPILNIFIVAHIHIQAHHTYGEKEVSTPTFKFVCFCVFMHKTIKSYLSPVLNQHYKVHSRLSYFSICSFSLRVKNLTHFFCLFYLLTCSVLESVQISHSVLPDSATPWTAACQAFLKSWTPRAYSDSCPSSWWCHPTISSLVMRLSSHLQSLPESGSFPMSQFSSGIAKALGLQLQHKSFQQIFRTDFL